MPRDEAQTSLLDRVYRDLDLVNGTLLAARSEPGAGEDAEEWRSVGDWLLLADRVGADRVFFVNADPVLIFSTLPAGAGRAEVLEAYRRTWSLSRPRCLFLAVGDGLQVYGLGEPPVDPRDESRTLTPLEVLDRAADVGEALAGFHRDRIESGAAFEPLDAVGLSTRADEQLLRDVEGATEALIGDGLRRETAHALIERAILVRYLEDRGVLTESYFEKVAARRAAWTRYLHSPQVAPDFGRDSLFIRCLADPAFTNELFAQLAVDFNGDLFVPEPHEHLEVEGRHLARLQSLLQGAHGAAQQQLFFWAYDFSVVPTSLVSTMYELFYHQDADGEPTSTYYTPPQLVEFVLGEVLTEAVLDENPQVCDPACGSGVFLVEALRRIVRHEMVRAGGSLSSERLTELLLERVRGVEIDAAAVRLAAFSLYVAFLNYQTPRDIQKAGPLPPLIARGDDPPFSTPLRVGDAFAVSGTASFGVVVGNPPWTEPRKGPRNTAEEWATRRGVAFGDKNPSQLFLWLALDLLADNGVAALLVGANALFNSRTTAREFRRQWLAAARLEHVAQFAEVRKDYFKGASAPFALMRFRKPDGRPDGPVIYETARSPRVQRGSLAYARLDRRIVLQESLRDHDFLWKTYMAGGHNDEALVFRLADYGRMEDLIDPAAEPRFGYQRGKPSEPGAKPPSARLAKLPSLKDFVSWGPVEPNQFEAVPEFVKWEPHAKILEGRRLVVSLGVAPGFGLHARIETAPFAFRHNILAVPLGHRPVWQAHVALGTLLSSVGRYWLYMVAGGWGLWRDQVRKGTLLAFPIRLTEATDPRVGRISSGVQKLPRAESPSQRPREIWEAADPETESVGSILAELDDAVADLFELTDAERDLVAEFWANLNPAATASITPLAIAAGTVRSLDALEPTVLVRYLRAFLDMWNPQFGSDGELDWHIHRDRSAGVVAAVFETRASDAPPSHQHASDDEPRWGALLARLGATLTRERAAMLHSHGVVRVVTDTAIVIVKRDEQRLWTASAAREDAEATTLQAMALKRDEQPAAAV